jgi:PAS domain S-box-containing protein
MSKKKEMLVLHLEDSAKDSELVEAKLAEEGFNCSLVRVENERDFISALEGTRFDLILADYSLPSFDGLSALKISLEKRPEVPFIFISGAIGEEFAIEMLKSGATDYVLKNRMSRLAPAVNRALQAAKNRIERNLIESERLLLAVAIESTADAVMITDPGWNIKYVNSSFERITSLSKEEVLGRDFGLMWNGQDQSFNHVKDTLQKDDSWSGKITNQRKDATPYEADTTISSVKSPQGEVVNYVAVLRDITEKKRLESIAETVSISENIGHFSSGIRHEIGNPINSIKIRLGLLKDKILGHLYEESLGLIERIDGDLARAEYILRALKYYNFFENPELKKIDMPALIDSIASRKPHFQKRK